MFTYTETPQRDIWEHLKFLSIENNCKRLLKGEIKSSREISYIDGEILNRKSKEISMCLKQANEYFMASETTSINTSPLLMYYGMQSLSKALIVANTNGLFLDEIKYHGLETRPRFEYLKEYSERQESWNIENEFALTNEGVFNHLVSIFDKFVFPQHSVIEFKDVIKCIPELWGIYEKYYGESPNILGLYSMSEGVDSSYNVKICISGRDPKKILEIIPELETDFTIEDGLYHDQSVVFNSKELESFPTYMGTYSPQFGGDYLIKGVRYFDGADYRNRFISLESLDYVAMFILSICVRYKQVLWGEIISGEKSGSISLINLYMNSIKRRFPNRILNELFNEKFIYGVSGYL